MGKMYTLDKKLLIGSPEIQIGDKVFQVDDRNKTVRKVIKLSEQLKGKDKEKDIEETPEKFEVIDQILELAFGSKYKDIDELELSFRAYLDLIDIVLDAMTNGDPEKYEKEKAEKEESFRSGAE
ncbi:MAG: hypothetical protein K5979_07500 [Ruminococcus sp.]|nr:hypothetical protein [Ruminococcus sp.]